MESATQSTPSDIRHSCGNGAWCDAGGRKNWPRSTFRRRRASRARTRRWSASTCAGGRGCSSCRAPAARWCSSSARPPDPRISIRWRRCCGWRPRRAATPTSRSSTCARRTRWTRSTSARPARPTSTSPPTARSRSAPTPRAGWRSARASTSTASTWTTWTTRPASRSTRSRTAWPSLWTACASTSAGWPRSGSACRRSGTGCSDTALWRKRGRRRAKAGQFLRNKPSPVV